MLGNVSHSILFAIQEFIETLDADTIKKLCIRSLQQGVGSMGFVDSLLIMEDDNTDDELDAVSPEASAAPISAAAQAIPSTHPHISAHIPTPPRPVEEPLPDWCKCGNCHTMPQEIENICCKNRNCQGTKRRFAKLCLDVDVLSLCIKSNAGIRNDPQNNSTRAFKRAAYRQYISDKHGYLGKGRRRVAPSCVVGQIRNHLPSTTGVYMGFREH